MVLYCLENCPPCVTVKNELARKNIEIKTRLVLRDATKNPDVLNKEIITLGIRSFPTLLSKGKLITGIANILAEILKK